MTQRPPTLDYRIDEGAQVRPMWPSLKLAMTIAFDSAIIFVLFRLTPQLEEWLKSHAMGLPLITRFWLGLAKFFNNDYGWVLFLMAVGTAISIVITIRPAFLSDPTARGSRSLMKFCLLVFFAVPVVTAIFAAVLPYFSMLDQLSSPQTGR